MHPIISHSHTLLSSQQSLQTESQASITANERRSSRAKKVINYAELESSRVFDLRCNQYLSTHPHRSRKDRRYWDNEVNTYQYKRRGTRRTRLTIIEEYPKESISHEEQSESVLEDKSEAYERVSEQEDAKEMSLICTIPYSASQFSAQSTTFPSNCPHPPGILASSLIVPCPADTSMASHIQSVTDHLPVQFQDSSELNSLPDSRSCLSSIVLNQVHEQKMLQKPTCPPSLPPPLPLSLALNKQPLSCVIAGANNSQATYYSSTAASTVEDFSSCAEGSLYHNLKEVASSTDSVSDIFTTSGSP